MKTIFPLLLAALLCSCNKSKLDRKLSLREQAEESFVSAVTNITGWRRTLNARAFVYDAEWTNWTAMAEIEFINQRGGVERTNLNFCFRVGAISGGEQYAVCSLVDDAYRKWEEQIAQRDEAERKLKADEAANLERILKVRQEDQAEAAAVAVEQRVARVAAELKHHQELAAKGDAYGQLKMGERYLKGEGVEQDKTQAIAWLLKSAAQGNPTAQQLLQIITASATK